MANSAYAEQFNNPDFKLHNGIDARTGAYSEVYKDGKLSLEVATEYPVYCPVDGFVVTEVDYQPQGGGNQVGLTSKERVQVGDKTCYASVIMCHAKKVLVKVGDTPRVGDLLMIADNTGFSTGLHTHIGLYRLTDSYQKLDSNEATGSYNPALCWSGQFAVDVASVLTLIAAATRYYRYVLTGA